MPPPQDCMTLQEAKGPSFFPLVKEKRREEQHVDG